MSIAHPSISSAPRAAHSLGSGTETTRLDASPFARDIQGRILAASDAITLLFAMECTQCDSQTRDGESAIRDKGQRIKDAIAAARAAAAAAREAAEDKGFWDDVCSFLETVAAVAGIVATAASAVASGGLTSMATIALVGALLSATAEPLGKELGASADFTRALGIVGGLMSLTGGIGAASGIKDVAVESGKTVQRIKSGAMLVGATAHAIEGYASYRSGAKESDRLDFVADGMQARSRQRALQREIGDFVEGLKELGKSFQHAKQSLIEAQNDMGDARMMALQVGRFA